MIHDEEEEAAENFQLQASSECGCMVCAGHREVMRVNCNVATEVVLMMVAELRSNNVYRYALMVEAGIGQKPTRRHLHLHEILRWLAQYLPNVTHCPCRYLSVPPPL